MVEEAINEYNIIEKAINACPGLKSYLKDEAQSVALEHLWLAAIAYDPNNESKASFPTFAWKRLLGAIKEMSKKEARGYMTYVPTGKKVQKLEELPTNICDDRYITSDVDNKIDMQKLYNEDLNYEEKTILKLTDDGLSIHKISKIMEYSPGKVKTIMLKLADLNHVIPA